MQASRRMLRLVLFLVVFHVGFCVVLALLLLHLEADWERGHTAQQFRMAGVEV